MWWQVLAARLGEFCKVKARGRNVMQVRNLLSWIRKMINQAPDPGAEDRAPQHSRIMQVKELLRKLEELGGDELWLLTTLVGKGEEHACKQAAKESTRSFKEWVKTAQDPTCKDVQNMYTSCPKHV